MVMMMEKVHIFSNGTDFDYWLMANCERCQYSTFNNGQEPNEMPICRIEYALTLACIGDGMVTEQTKSEALNGENNYTCEYRNLTREQASKHIEGK